MAGHSGCRRRCIRWGPTIRIKGRLPSPMNSGVSDDRARLAALSLCHRRVCPGACVRVCHCPLGLWRSHQLFDMYRNRRLVITLGLRPRGGLSPSRWSDVEFQPNAEQDFGSLNQPEQGWRRLYYPTHNYHPQPPIKGFAVKSFGSWAFLVGFLVLLAAVIAYGLATYGTNLVPFYHVPNVNLPD